MRSTALALLVLAAVAAWLPSTVVAKCPADSAMAAFLAPGPYAVAHRTLTLVDTSRPSPAHGSVPESPERTLVTEVWYPVDAGAGAEPPIAHGKRFPLVFDSPGLIDQRLFHLYYVTALASRGYVVASSDFPETGISSAGGNVNLGDVQHQPGDVSFVIDQLLTLAKTKGSWLAGGIDKHKIGASGLSLGGLTTLLVTYHPTLRDPRVRASLAIAPASCFLVKGLYRVAKPPLLVLQGDQDLIVPIEENGARAFEFSNSPRRLVTLTHAGHAPFADPVSDPPGGKQTSFDLDICGIVVDNTTGIDHLGDGLGGLQNGIDAAACTQILPCQQGGPPNPPMMAGRQHDITKAVVSAFFESTFRHSRAARCLLTSGLATLPDVHVESAPGRRLPRKK